MAKSNNDKEWSEAVRRAVHRREKGQKSKYLDRLADVLVQAGMNADIGALKEIGDRLQGRSVVPVAVEVEGDLKITWQK